MYFVFELNLILLHKKKLQAESTKQIIMLFTWFMLLLIVSIITTGILVGGYIGKNWNSQQTNGLSQLWGETLGALSGTFVAILITDHIYRQLN